MINAQTTGLLSTSTATLPNGGEACSVEQVVLRHLTTEQEIASVLHLREEIDLSALALAGVQEFERLEKKEMNSAWCSVSTCGASASGRSASSRLALA
jgi:hypothetical protein